MKKILLAIVVFAVLAGVGSACSSTGGDKGAEDKSGDTTASPTVASTKGKQPMRWGNWELVGKIKVAKGYDGEFEPDFGVKNTGNEPDTGSFIVKFLQGKKILGTADCTTALDLSGTSVSPGKDSPIRCDDGDKFQTGWTEITIEDGTSF